MIKAMSPAIARSMPKHKAKINSTVGYLTFTTVSVVFLKLKSPSLSAAPGMVVAFR